MTPYAALWTWLVGSARHFPVATAKNVSATTVAATYGIVSNEHSTQLPLWNVAVVRCPL